MIQPEEWMTSLVEKLRERFASRLLYVGLQGSYRRGEASESSDIDVVVLMDEVSLDDLDSYRSIVHAMPEGEKACGFISGVKDFARWPAYELFPFKMDTADWYGKLADFLPRVTMDDIMQSARFGAAGLYHLLTHSYLYADVASRPEVLRGAYKAAYFVMQVSVYLATGTYHTSKKSLLDSVDGDERKILQAGLDFTGWSAAHSEKESFALLRDWCRMVLERTSGNE